MSFSWKWGRAGTARPSVAVLLSEVDHGKPADATGTTGFDMEEVHPAGDDLVIAVPDIPILCSATSRAVVLEQRHQYSAGGVDPDDAVRRQVHELDDLGVRGLLELVGDVVWI